MNQTLKLGVIIGLIPEANRLFGRRCWRKDNGRLVCRLNGGSQVNIIGVCSGVGLTSASRAASYLVRQNVAVLISYGVSGGIRPDLQSGDLLIPEIVMQPESQTGGIVQWDVNTLIEGQALDCLREQRLVVHRGPIISTPNEVLSCQKKIELHRHHGAVAVDMESAAVAAIGYKQGLPVLILRAVCDTLAAEPSPATFHTVDSKGQVRLFFLLRQLLLQPTFALELWQMQKAFGKAIRRLKKAWPVFIDNMVRMV